MPINNFREDEQTKQVLKVVTLKRLFAYLTKYKKEIIQVLLLMCVIIVVTIVNPILIKIAIDDYIRIGKIDYGLWGIALIV
jgi:ATP-binding cassette, subfamily B, multidrug efflux pump